MRHHLVRVTQKTITVHPVLAAIALLWISSGGLVHALDTHLTNAPSAAPNLSQKITFPNTLQGGAGSAIDPGAIPVAIGTRMQKLLTAAQSANAATIQPAAAGRIQKQQNAIRLLRQRAGQDVEVRLRPGSQTVMQIRGAILEPASTGVAPAFEGARERRTARNFLRANRDLLQIEDPDSELAVSKQAQDDLGQTHVKFEQTYKSIPVWPSGLGVHLDRDGNVHLVDGAYVPTPSEVLTEPTLAAAEATERAKASVQKGEKAETSAPALIIYSPLEKAPRLAWKLSVTVSLLNSWTVIVDALDGRVLNKITEVLDANVVGSTKDLLGKTRPVNVWSQDGKFYMLDTSKQMFKAGSDPFDRDTQGVIKIFDGQDKTPEDAAIENAILVTSTDANTWLPDAVSATFNFSLTYDYYLQHHNRNSLDGKGGNVIAIVRIADEKHNAAWSSHYQVMVFGDDIPLAAGLDVIGHELTHGVTEKTAGLVYQDQPGALNEAMSDIFGEFVEASRDGQPDWLMGEEIPLIIRNFKNPGEITRPGIGAFPSKMSEFKNLPPDQDHGGVHINSSIINHACYLLTVGLNGAVGLGDAEKIFYRALTQHLQAQSQFVDARLACVASAEEIFGANSAQVAKVKEAFDAVEILDTPSTPAPTPIPTVQGPDSTLLIGFDPSVFEIALGRREAALGDPVDGVALVESVKTARPAVSGDGSFALFVDSAYDVCGVNTDNPNTLQCLGFQGLVHSVAIAPNSTLSAFVLRDPVSGQPQDKINVFNLGNNTTKTYKLVSPVADGTSVDSVLYADSMVFSSDSKTLIYDAVSQLRFGTGTPVQRWSIFAINLATDTATVLLPPQEGIDIGNPNMGRAGNRFLTFDARDVKTGNTAILNLDLFTGQFAAVGSVGQGLGFPCFTGDESAVIYAAPDSQAPLTGFSLIKQPLAADRLTKDGQPTLWFSDATIGVIYRRGTFTSSNALPQVRILSPTDGQSFTIPGNFVLEIDAKDSDGQVAKVELYDGSEKLTEWTAPPYRATVKFDTNVVPHTFRFIARAIDNVGGATDSTPVNISLTQSGGGGGSIRISAVKLANASIRLTVTGAAGNYTIQQSTDLKTWADIYPVTVGAAGTGSVDDSGGPANNRSLFYRARKN
ncbi:MAG: M4 family metallopeptidase [Verrucomicrobia bacterium]|nr:M4 family metallopeptidase [Verrucomicrobiota bacterium]